MSNLPIVGSDMESAAPVTTPNLTELSLRAIKWSYLGVVARIVAQLGIQIVLARILGPEVFGIFAAASLVLGLGIVSIGLGLGSALVQKKEITANDIRFTFTWSVISGVGMAILTLLFASDIAAFFHDPRIADVLRGLVPVFIFISFSIVPQALLKRELTFKVIQGVEITSYLIGFLVVGMGCALMGAGVWSLVAAWVAQSASNTIILFVIRRHAMKPLLREKGPGLRKFGSHVLFTNIVNLVIENLDNLLVGRLLGPTTLGLYSVAYTFVRTPTNHLVVTLQNVLFSASARAQDNQAGLQRAYLTVVSAISLVIIPVFAGVAAVPYTVIDGIFGHKWLAAAQVLMPLSLAMILHAIMAVTGPVLSGKGAPSAEFKVQFWVALVLIVALLIAARYSIVAVAWAVFGVYALRLVLMVNALVRHVQLPPLAFLLALRGGVIVGVPVVVVLLLADMSLRGLAPLAQLSLEILLAAAIYFLTIRVFQRQVIVAELRSVLLTWAGHSGLAKRGCRLMGLGG